MPTGPAPIYWEGRSHAQAKERGYWARGTVDGFEGSNVFILWTESVRRDANGVRGYYIYESELGVCQPVAEVRGGGNDGRGKWERGWKG